MHVDTMRRIDHWAGAPLCLLLDLWFKLAGIFVRRKGCESRRVLFVELSEMGSAILADPAMRLARCQGAELHFVIFKKNAASLGLLNTVPAGNIFTLRNDGLLKLAVDVLGFLIWCRRRRIDTVVDLELFARFTALLSGLSGARNRIGFHSFHNEGLYRGNFMTRPVAYNPHIHIAKNFLSLVHAAYAETPQRPYTKQLIGDEEMRLEQAPEDAGAIAEVIKIVAEIVPDFVPNRQRLVLVNPNGSDLLPQRRWMPERFVEIMKCLATSYEDVRILITGAPEEQQQADSLCQAVNHPNCHSIAGKLRLQQLIPLYQCSRLMLTNDSGPAHFAAVTSIKTFVLFGPETPSLYGALGNSTPIYAGLACSPCVSAANHRKTPCRDNVCLQLISSQQVLKLLRDELDGDRQASTGLKN